MKWVRTSTIPLLFHSYHSVSLVNEVSEDLHYPSALPVISQWCQGVCKLRTVPPFQATTARSCRRRSLSSLSLWSTPWEVVSTLSPTRSSWEVSRTTCMKSAGAAAFSSSPVAPATIRLWRWVPSCTLLTILFFKLLGDVCLSTELTLFALQSVSAWLVVFITWFACLSGNLC